MILEAHTAAGSSISRLSYKPASSYGEAAARAKFEGAQFLLDELHEVCDRKSRTWILLKKPLAVVHVLAITR